MTITLEDKVNCRICGSGNMSADRCFSDPFFVSEAGKRYSFSICNDCGTVQCQNGGIHDYEADSSAYNVRQHINYELASNAGLYFFAYLLLLAEAALGSKGNKRILEVGGGLGITSHIAKLSLNWRETNVDPNTRAALAREFLQINSFSGFADKLGSEHQGVYDVVLSSEVIEHLENPDAFIQSIKYFLTEGGILILTTPNSQAVALSNKNADFVDVVESYSVGQHYNLFSKHSLRILLERNVFEDILITLAEGESNDKRLVVAAKLHKGASALNVGNIERKSINRLFKKYTEKAKLESCKNNFHSVYLHGLDFRLFETLVNEGNFTQALELSVAIENYLSENNSGINAADAFCAGSFNEMMDKYVSFSGKFFYYYGLLCMNHLIDYQAALRYFSASYNFSCMQNTLFFSHIGRYIGLAAIHKARVLGFLGKYEEGVSFLLDSLEIERIPKDIRAGMTSEIEALRLHADMGCTQ